MTPEQKLAQIKEYVALQAEDLWLWNFPLDRNETMQEAYLRRALRKLYTIIESDNAELIEQMFDVYKKFIEEQK
jgi:predicted HAD superfamily phosphohydrolase